MIRSLRGALTGLAALMLVSSCGVAPAGPQKPAADPRDAATRYSLLTAEPNCPPTNCNAATGEGAFGETGSFAFSVVDSPDGDQSAINVNAVIDEDLVFFNSQGALTVSITPDAVTGDLILLASGPVVGPGPTFRQVMLRYNLTTNIYTLEVEGLGQSTGTGTSTYTPGSCTLTPLQV